MDQENIETAGMLSLNMQKTHSEMMSSMESASKS
jgi:hypothetical protein